MNQRDPEPPLQRLSGAQPLRIASWNVQACRQGLPAAASLLRSLDADLVALQEVERCTRRSKGCDQAELLAQEAGFSHHCFFPTLLRDRGEYGLALLSRWPLSEPSAVPLPVHKGLEHRILASVLAELPPGPLPIYFTHLSHWTRSKLRKEQAQYICRQLEEAAPPYLLLGDFNDLPGSPMHRKLSAMMVDAFAAVGAGRRGTHRVLPFLPALRIDYLFASRDLILERARVAATHASDHHALVVELRVAHVRPSEYDLAQLKNA